MIFNFPASATLQTAHCCDRWSVVHWQIRATHRVLWPMWPQQNPLPWKRPKSRLPNVPPISVFKDAICWPPMTWINQLIDPPARQLPASWTKFANFIGKFDDVKSIWLEFHWCRSVDVGMLCIFAFESNVIGWSVRSQDSRKDRSPAGAAIAV
jgi:hypothetical protein